MGGGGGGEGCEGWGGGFLLKSIKEKNFFGEFLEKRFQSMFLQETHPQPETESIWRQDSKYHFISAEEVVTVEVYVFC